VAVVHGHELMLLGIKEAVERAGVGRVVLERERVEGLVAALPMEGVQVLLLHAGLGLQVVLHAVQMVQRRWPGTAVLLLGEWTDVLVGRTLDVEVNGLLHNATRTAELVKAVTVVAHGGLYLNKPMRSRIKGTRKDPAKLKGPIKLTPAEEELLRAICRMDQPTYMAIAEEFQKSVRTVETHRDNLFRKFKVNTRGKLKDQAREQGFL
jgi:DNA-binding NarL/FixJ family response regulator